MLGRIVEGAVIRTLKCEMSPVNRIDPYGNEVTRKSPGNHTPIVWDWCWL
ncbi:hypothetical protein [Promicromonospora sp. NPDC023805]